MQFINPEYINENEYLEKVISFLFEVILKPNVISGEFSQNDFNIVKNEIEENGFSIKGDNPYYLLVNFEYVDPGYNYDNTITNYSEYELGIISSLIAFHEVDRKLPVEESKLILLNFIKKYTGLKEINDLDKIYKCAEIIRDSDALDRTRFTGIGKDMLSPKYLYYKSSKSLVKFSCAIRDRFYVNRIINLGGEESIINELLNYYDSQKLLDLVNRESSNYPELDINKYLKFLLKNIKGKQNEKK